MVEPAVPGLDASNPEVKGADEEKKLSTPEATVAPLPLTMPQPDTQAQEPAIKNASGDPDRIDLDILLATNIAPKNDVPPKPAEQHLDSGIIERVPGSVTAAFDATNMIGTEGEANSGE